MATQPKTRLSKEFQIKLRREVVTSDDAAIALMMSILDGIEKSGRYDFKVKSKSGKKWERRGERYDTLPDVGLFKSHRLSLATEKRTEEAGDFTKLKCKIHNFVPELLYRTINDSPAYPEAGPYADDPAVEPKYKLEQDIHFDNCKTCATGYITLPGRDHAFQKVGDFYPYYPNLKNLPGAKKSQPLIKVRDWNEVVFDDIEMRLGDWEIRGALVTRRDFVTHEWDETEFSFKLRADEQLCDAMNPAVGWDFDGLQTLSAIYDEMVAMDSVFVRYPSIFTFADPVSSTKIVVP